MASKTNGVDSSGWARAPPKKGPIGERILKAIYDSEEKAFLGRTPKRWGILFVFYTVFYAALALLFALCMAGLFQFIEDDKPHFMLDGSLIGTNPGLAFRPRPEDGVTLEYFSNNASSTDSYVQDMAEFIKPYLKDPSISSKTECTEHDNFGYPESPCVFIKLNKIYGWNPDYYTSDFPPDMPNNLIEYVKNLTDVDRQQIWISCWEEQNNSTTIQYPWGQGLASHYFPYLNQPDYVSPLLAVKFTPTIDIKAVLRCRAWAKNIIYNKSIKEPTGYTRIIITYNTTKTDSQ